MGPGCRGNWVVTKGPCTHSAEWTDRPKPPHPQQPVAPPLVIKGTTQAFCSLRPHPAPPPPQSQSLPGGSRQDSSWAAKWARCHI